MDDSVESDLFDLHRLRHVIEPEVNLFTSAETVHRDEVYLYDPRVDAVNDVSAAQIALHQRWQTYRGGPGRWRSVDFLTLDVEADLFANQPSRKTLNPYGFRGLFFPSEPEISIPRNAINGNLQWRISDNTVAAGRRPGEHGRAQAGDGGRRRRWSAATSTWTTTSAPATSPSSTPTSRRSAIDYQLTPKYTVSFSQSVDFGMGKNVETVFALTRKFDNCSLIVRAYTNETTGQNGFGVNLIPSGVSYGVDTHGASTTRWGIRGSGSVVSSSVCQSYVVHSQRSVGG